MKPPPKQATWFKATSSASLGIEIAVAISICALGGSYLERHVTHWSPWTTLIAIAIGIGAAAKAIIRTTRNYLRELEAERKSKSPGDES